MRTTKKNIYISAAVLLAVLLLPFIFPTFYGTLGNSNNTVIDLAKPIDTNPRQFIAAKLKSINSQNTQFPRGTAVLSWEQDSPLAVEKFDIYIDNLTHTYYIPVGENPYWRSAGKIIQVDLSLPQVQGIEFEVESLKLNQRRLPALDSYLNSYFKQTFSLDHINRFLIPSYLILGLGALLSIIYYAAFRPSPRFNPVVVVSLTILVLFALNFLTAQIYTAKSYWLSYKSNIQQKDLSSTYQGFYDFEKFIAWVGRSLPQEQNLSVLVKGQPVYIMSEMAYNLYPRDIRFIDISEKSNSQVLEEIDTVSRDGYNHVVILSEQDLPQSSKLSLVDSYREDAGYIYLFSAE